MLRFDDFLKLFTIRKKNYQVELVLSCLAIWRIIFKFKYHLKNLSNCNIHKLCYVKPRQFDELFSNSNFTTKFVQFWIVEGFFAMKMAWISSFNFNKFAKMCLHPSFESVLQAKKNSSRQNVEMLKITLYYHSTWWTTVCLLLSLLTLWEEILIRLVA